MDRETLYLLRAARETGLLEALLREADDAAGFAGPDVAAVHGTELFALAGRVA